MSIAVRNKGTKLFLVRKLLQMENDELFYADEIHLSKFMLTIWERQQEAGFMINLPFHFAVGMIGAVTISAPNDVNWNYEELSYI